MKVKRDIATAEEVGQLRVSGTRMVIPLLLAVGTAALLAKSMCAGMMHAGKCALSGGIACSISHAAATPLDVIKTRMQFDPSRYRNMRTGRALGLRQTGTTIIREEGAHMLLQGVGTTFLGYFVQGSCKYGLWEVFKTLLGYSEAFGINKILIIALAALSADIVASLLLCPFERARIKLVSEPGYSLGTLSALSRMLAEDGFRSGFFGKGLAPTLLKQQSYTVSKLTTFTVLLDTLRGKLGSLPRIALTLLSSMVAGLVASIASQPGDTLQVCTSADASQRRADCPVDPETGKPPKMLVMAHQLGWKRLFTGWRPRLLHVEIVVVSQLLVYDLVKSSLGL